MCAAVAEALLDMEMDPFIGDIQKIKGGSGWRRRIGKYRILYDVDTDLHLVSILGIFHRSEAYRP
jgi:mRNA-degrading endonuclease RelE of RelBE toxin-antitoxin system